jgi:DNA (cytosine-5)-methyltransferase 1
LASVHYGNGFNTSVDAPAPTLTTKDRLGLVTSTFIANEYSGGGQISDIEQPCPAVLTTPKQKVVSAQYIMNPYSFKSDGGSIDKPCFTLIARMDKMPPYLVSTKEGLAIEVYETDSPMTVSIKEFMALYGIADIRMRMLRIPELKRIMGFPEDYTLIGTQAEQKKFIGNAVEVGMARVLCEALCNRLNKIRRG